MELGLSLGDASSKPNGFLRKSTEISSGQKSGLGFCMGLGINPNPDAAITGRKSPEDVNISDGSSEETVKETSRELHLLPLAPLHRPSHQHSFPWSSGSSEGCSSGNVPAARGFDVNRLAATPEEVTSPNSAASSFRLDFGIYNGSMGGGDKRELETSGNDVVEGDDDENGLARKKLRLSKEQSAFLEESFKEHNTLNPKQKLALAKHLNLRPRQVEVWFQNRRARTKLKQTEVDCEYLKRCCETLTEENRKLHKELQELRALKTSNPFYMQLPATTLTMCPSCERVATTSTAAPAATTAAPPAVKPTDLTISSKPITTATPSPFPMGRPKFYPFSQTTSTAHPHQSAAS